MMVMKLAIGSLFIGRVSELETLGLVVSDIYVLNEKKKLRNFFSSSASHDGMILDGLMDSLLILTRWTLRSLIDRSYRILCVGGENYYPTYFNIFDETYL